MKIQEIMRYLGYRNHEADQVTRKRVESLKDEMEQTIRPKWHYQRFEVAKWEPTQVLLKDCPFPLAGESIAKHLQDSKAVYLLCVTLGIESERMLMRKQAESVADGMIVDSCLSAYVEEAADQGQDAIRREIETDEELTFRFSPGYGDLSLDIQKEMIRLTRWDRILGVSLTHSMMMVPSKSIIAVIGVELMKKDEKNTKTMQPCGNQNCEACELKEQCNWQK